MRIVIDMQGAQAENRFRGIGRYALALVKAIIRNRGSHEIVLALNGQFSEAVKDIRDEMSEFSGQVEICVWSTGSPSSYLGLLENNECRKSIELSREVFLASCSPEIIIITSLFEGLGDDAVTSIGCLAQNIPIVSILYDLIPFIYSEIYLENPVVKSWYSEKIEYLRKADLLLSISESSRIDCINYLAFPGDRAYNISADADPRFQIRGIPEVKQRSLREKYGVLRSFIMYTGGIDYRKNIEGMIRSYANLPKNLRVSHQLLLVCSVQPDEQIRLEQFSIQNGMEEKELILSGYVSDEDLVALYNLCKLFIFPSWYEGFGLPVLEAMRCGAPVIGANNSSISDVIGSPEALFDAHSDKSITQSIERGLTDEAFRARLIENGRIQAARFSWDESAKRAIVEIENFTSRQNSNCLATRPRLAFVSPLPPLRSGVASYSAGLLRDLISHYEIDVVVDQEMISDPWIIANFPVRSAQWFLENGGDYDRVLYHFGNSEFHSHMFDLLAEHPGVVVLHDFFLSGIRHHMEFHYDIPRFWTQALYRSHGYSALKTLDDPRNTGELILKYPCNLSVIQQSVGLIVHSQYSVDLAKHWYGQLDDSWVVVKHARSLRAGNNKKKAMDDLSLTEESFVVCCFGLLNPAKLNHRVINAWFKSELAGDENCHLFFVGENDAGEYGVQLLESIKENGAEQTVHITGWVEADVYGSFLEAADVAVQLRSDSRGETSGATLDCMSCGIATIVCACGTFSELNKNEVWLLPEEFPDDQLVAALEKLREDKNKRLRLGAMARKTILEQHNPRECANQYQEAIEQCYTTYLSRRCRLMPKTADISKLALSDGDLVSLASAVAMNTPPRCYQKQLLIDVSRFSNAVSDRKGNSRDPETGMLKDLLLNPPYGYRVEPVFSTPDQGYYYARRFSADILGLPENILEDEPIEFANGDVEFDLNLRPVVEPLDLRDRSIRSDKTQARWSRRIVGSSVLSLRKWVLDRLRLAVRIKTLINYFPKIKALLIRTLGSTR